MKKTITVFNRRIPNPIPLFVSAALLISLFALSHFNQSTAWYMQNKDVSANGMQVTSIVTASKSEIIFLLTVFILLPLSLILIAVYYNERTVFN